MTREKDPDAMMYWIVCIEGKKVYIILNDAGHHFGRKHLLLPLTNTTKSPLSIEDAAKKRLKSRRTKSGNHTPKYNIKNKKVKASTVLNLRPNEGHRGIDEKEAAVVFAKALLVAKKNQIQVNFKRQCVHTVDIIDQRVVSTAETMTVQFKRTLGDYCFRIEHCVGS
jgi:hypothetical protein